MDELLKREGRDGRYRLRKITVEPVFGQIKHARRFRQFLLCGFGNVPREWSLVCIAHNLNKLVSAWPPARQDLTALDPVRTGMDCENRG